MFNDGLVSKKQYDSDKQSLEKKIENFDKKILYTSKVTETQF